MPIGAKSNAAQTQLLLGMRSRHPSGLGSAALKARAASFCGDGALSRGGPDHRHSSSGALEALWDRLHGPGTGVRSVTWDLFHKVGVAFLADLEQVQPRAGSI